MTEPGEGQEPQPEEGTPSKAEAPAEFSIKKYIPVMVIIVIVSVIQLFLHDEVASWYGNILIDSGAALCLALSLYLVVKLRHSQFREICIALMLNCLLFLIAEVTYSYQYMVLGMDEWITIADVFWLGGYIPLMYICAKTMWMHHEHIDPRHIMLLFALWTLFLMMVIVPVAFMTFNMTDTFLEGLVLSMYPVLDMIMIFFLAGILVIYKKGLVRYYWLFITAAIAMYSTADLIYAIFASEEIYAVGSLPDVFYAIDYFVLALGLIVMILHRQEFQRLEPKGRYAIEHVYLAYRNGLLVGSAISEKAKRGVDPEVFIGMLTAIQDFVKDSFEEGETSRLDELKYGGQRFIFRRAENVMLVVMVAGDVTKVAMDDLDTILKEVNEKFGDILKDWDGELGPVSGVKDILDRLLTTP